LSDPVSADSALSKVGEGILELCSEHFSAHISQIEQKLQQELEAGQQRQSKLITEALAREARILRGRLFDRRREWVGEFLRVATALIFLLLVLLLAGQFARNEGSGIAAASQTSTASVVIQTPDVTAITCQGEKP
jgi:type VI protein secretion system component VasK